ncbi:MAG: transposase domain-containing protein, partial [Gammaproteobacteria bacterium]|nr:transposase domain-containing protein [Gammaproteobacteria bacterium]MBQ0721900.1 transposase domain-containing protein [Gammaproteobacteria bacterium]MBQ0838139.1 transposase domain-containing protein [Gammaproteobacteria bacterium]
LNPYDYLKEVFTRLPNVETVDDIERLLPWRLEITGVFATL